MIKSHILVYTAPQYLVHKLAGAGLRKKFEFLIALTH